jgi:hypothetical protein
LIDVSHWNVELGTFDSGSISIYVTGPYVDPSIGYDLDNAFASACFSNDDCDDSFVCSEDVVPQCLPYDSGASQLASLAVLTFL